MPGSPIRGAVGCSFSPYEIPHVLSVGFDVLSNLFERRQDDALEQGNMLFWEDLLVAELAGEAA